VLLEDTDASSYSVNNITVNQLPLMAVVSALHRPQFMEWSQFHNEFWVTYLFSADVIRM